MGLGSGDGVLKWKTVGSQDVRESGDIWEEKGKMVSTKMTCLEVKRFFECGLRHL